MKLLRIHGTRLVLLTVWAVACRSEPTSPPRGEPSEEPAASADREVMPETVRLTSAAIADAGIATWKIQPVDVGRLVVLNGSVGYNENRLVQLAANVKGRVVSIPVDLGARVRRGDTIVEIESVDLGRAREEFLKELAALRVDSRAYERARSLLQAKAISAGEFQAREGELLARRAAVQAAERALQLYGVDEDQVARLREAVQENATLPPAEPRLAIRAPFDGRVIERKVTPGSLFEALQPLAILADLSSVWVFLQAYEKDMALVREGLPVTLRTEAYPEESFRGRVDFLASVVDPSTRTVKVRATVGNREEKLRPGMFVKAHVEVPKPQTEAQPVLVVPQSALQSLEGRSMIFIQMGPGVFARRAVETGRIFEGFTEILSGVKPGDVVVSEGSFVLKAEFARATLAEER